MKPSPAVLLLFAIGLGIVLPVSAEESFSLVCTSRQQTEDGAVNYYVGARTPDLLEEYCPVNHAFMSVFLPRGPRRTGQFIPVAGNCCPLPPNALTEEHRFTFEQCPEGYVATGSRQLDQERGLSEEHISVTDPEHWKNVRRQQIRCTKVNTKLYTLAPESKGIQTGWGVHFRELLEPRTTRARIPPALRYGIGRLRETTWITSCIGLPWGSLLTGKSSKHCSGFSFRTLKPLQPNAAANSVADCLAVEDYLGAKARCIKEGL